MTGSAIQHTGRTNYNQVYRKVIKLPWNKWFAWYPVRVHGKYTWLKIVYRRSLLTYVDMDDWSRYEYGTIFDIIKE
jgi:hypothetical protein